MSKMYVDYAGNYGSAEDEDFMTFNTDDLSVAQFELLEEDPTEFYFAISSGDWSCLETRED
jgi:hypothetical protein